MDDTKFVLLAIFSEGAALGRLAGIKGVVQLVLQYTSYDEKWLKFNLRLRRQINCIPYRLHVFAESTIENDTVLLDHFLRRLTYYPRVTIVEKELAITLLEYIRKMMTLNWQVNLPFYEGLMNRIFQIFKNAPFHGHFLTQEVFRVQGTHMKRGRFPSKEVSIMNYDKLANEGIEIVKIHEDFRGCDAVLCTTKNEWVNTHVRLPNDYPFRSPSVTFTSSLRPRSFAKYETMAVEMVFEYAYTGVEDSLRAILLEMEAEGVVSTMDLSKNPVFV